MRQGLLRSSRYSPGNMDFESLKALFVGRQDVMDSILGCITDSIQSTEKHYFILVGPRGSGKTHFLSLAYHILNTRFDTLDIRDKVAVAVLKEEEWGVASFLDLIVRILLALSNESPHVSAKVSDVYEHYAKDPLDAEIYALNLLREVTKGKTLLLLCENLADLFEGLDEEGQKRWRAAIQEDGNWTIIATTPSLFASLTLQNMPFFGFFTVRSLERIDFGTAMDLLIKKARYENKTSLASFLGTPMGRARARAIHHLAGGNHRVYVVMFDFLNRQSLDDLVDPFMQMVDELTPYYQASMRSLPPSQRKIVEFLCTQSNPQTIKEIVVPCLMTHQTATKQIGDLEKAGFVKKTRKGRHTYCELAEPLMRICIEVKDNRTNHFQLFVEFLRHWFSHRELAARHKTHLDAESEDKLDRIHVEAAVRCHQFDEHDPFVDSLQIEAQNCWESSNYEGLVAIQRELVRSNGTASNYAALVHGLVGMDEGEEAIKVGLTGESKFPNDSFLQFKLTYAFFIENRFDEALTKIQRAIAIDGRDPKYLCIFADVLLRIGRHEEAIEVANEVLDAKPDHWYSLKQNVDALVQLGRVSEAEERARELTNMAPEDPEAMLAGARFFYSQDHLEEALGIVNRVLAIDPEHLGAHELFGNILFEMGDYVGASSELRTVTSHLPNSVPTHCRLADTLLLSGEWKEAIKVASRLIEIDPTHSRAHYVSGSALIALERYDEAVEVFQKLLPTNDCHSLLTVASELRDIGDYHSARRFLSRVEELDPRNRVLWFELTNLFIDSGDFDNAEECSADAREVLGSASLGALLKAQVNAATKPLEVAVDSIRAVLVDKFLKEETELLEQSVVRMLNLSVRHFGPEYLSNGLRKLNAVLAQIPAEGVIERVLIKFLIENVNEGFEGSLGKWEEMFDSLAKEIDDHPNLVIPLRMTRVAVLYNKSREESHLLELPLEERQLLEEVINEFESSAIGYDPTERFVI